MNIFEMAFVLIYPDGYVDYIPIKTGISSHVSYLYEYLKVSPRFQRLVRENHFKFDWINEDNCSLVVKLLAQNNVIVFMNLAIRYIQMDMANAKDLAYFVVDLPTNYEDLPTIHEAREQINKLNDDQFKIEKYQIDIDDFDVVDSDEQNKVLK